MSESMNARLEPAREITVEHLHEAQIDLARPTPLYAVGGHCVYWLGIADETAFRCNVYLIQDGDDAYIVDPGSRGFFAQVRARVAQIMDPARVNRMILCHQDPDVAASMVDWLEFNPDMEIWTSPRTEVLLPHFGSSDYHFVDVTENPSHTLKSGAELRFIEAPFLHSPSAVAVYDSRARYLLSGDIWAALDMEWSLTVRSFEAHKSSMDLFNMDYMSSNIAARGFVNRLDGIEIDAILPQHGSIIGPEHVADALAYLRELRCGIDIVYADLQT